MTNKTVLVLAAFMASLMAMPFLASFAGAADSCNVSPIALPPAGTLPPGTIPAAAPQGVYLVVNPTTQEVLIYAETNGIPGLQRGGAGPTEPVWQATGGFPIDDHDSCQPGGTPDLLIF